MPNEQCRPHRAKLLQGISAEWELGRDYTLFNLGFTAKRGNCRQVCTEQIALKKTDSHHSLGTSGTMTLCMNPEVPVGSCLIEIRP